MIDDEDDAFGQVVQHGVGGVVQQVAAIEERNDLHARRQDVVVQFFDLRVDAFERGSESAPLRSSTMPSTTSSLSTILPSARWIALPIWPSRIFGPCATVAMS